jgi:hypothetical protein
MERSGISTIEFRYLNSGTATGGPAVQVLIDGMTLESRWNSNGKWRNSAPLCTWSIDEVSPLDLWSISFDPSAHDTELSEDGRVAVLTCACGELMCGGVAARIEFTDETVIWSDFVHANYHTPQGLSSFAFSRAQYDQALAEARRRAHR